MLVLPVTMRFRRPGRGYRIPATRGPRTAAQHAPHRQPGAVPGTVDADRLDGVTTARGFEPAARRGPRGDPLLVEVEHPQQDPREGARPPGAHDEPLARAAAAASPARISRTRSSCVAPADAGLARMTTMRSSPASSTRSAAI